jgi:hypothetical protein
MATLQHELGYILFGATSQDMLVATIGVDKGYHPVGFMFKVFKQANLDKQVSSLINLGVTRLDYASDLT